MRIRGDVQQRVGRLLLIIVLALLATSAYLPLVNDDPIGGMAALLIALAVMPLALSIRMGRFELFEPIIFHTAFFAMLVIGWIERMYITRAPLEYDIIQWTFEEGMLIAGGALAVLFAATMIGYYFFGPAATARLVPAGRRLKGTLADIDHLSGTPFRTLGGTYMLIGLSAIVVIVIVVFPTNELFYLFATEDPRSETFTGSGALVLVSRMLYIGYFLWLCGAIADRRTPSLIELLAALPITAIYLVLGGRGQALSIVVVVAIFVYYTVIEGTIEVSSGRLASLTDYIPPGILVLCLPIVGIGMATAIIALRGMRLGRSFTESVADVNIFSIMTAGVHTDVFDNFLGLMEFVPSQIGYFYGAFYARVLLNFVPRAIWPEKPVATSGGFFRRLVLPNQAGGRPPGAMGDIYLNFGLPGIPVVGVLYGILLHLTWHLVHGSRSSSISLLLFGLIIITIGKNGLTNNILISLTENIIVLLPAVGVLLMWRYYKIAYLDRTPSSTTNY